MASSKSRHFFLGLGLAVGFGAGGAHVRGGGATGEAEAFGSLDILAGEIS